MGGQNLSNTRYQPTEQLLSSANVSKLAPRWVFTTGGDLSATPALANEALYVPDWGGNLFKVHARTGALMWSRSIQEYTSIAHSISRATPAVDGGALYLGTLQGAYMLALKTGNGDLIWKTKLDNHPSAYVTQSPVVFQQRVYAGVSSDEEILTLVPGYRCCTFRGSVVALNAGTGRVIWKTYLTPDNHGVAGGYSGVAVWGSTPVVDAARNTLYVTTGNNYDVPKDVQACEKARQANPSLPTCRVPDNHLDSVVALDLRTGAVKWSTSLTGYDAWSFACFVYQDICPDPKGADYDFGQGPMLFAVNGSRQELLGVGQKSGVFWALDPDTGAVRWSTVVGPAGPLGGIQWGSATDGSRIYVAVTNTFFQPYMLKPSGVTTLSGSWSALDAATGKILWQTGVPSFAWAMGPVSVANGVVYAGSMEWIGDNMFALDAATGRIVWRFSSGGSVVAGAAVVDGSVYWGSGYSNQLQGRPNNKLYAFDIGH
jgi:polyvinyl alcohol dehydrogenase (cytochrome)